MGNFVHLVSSRSDEMFTRIYIEREKHGSPNTASHSLGPINTVVSERSERRARKVRKFPVSLEATVSTIIGQIKVDVFAYSIDAMCPA